MNPSPRLAGSANSLTTPTSALVVIVAGQPSNTQNKLRRRKAHVVREAYLPYTATALDERFVISPLGIYSENN